MAQLTQGETLTITQTVADATAVEARLGGASTGTHAMTADGTMWTVNIDTAAMQPGQYVAQVWATYAGNIKRIVSTESFTLSAALKAGDMRSNAAKALEMIDAMLAGQAKEGVLRYKINNRELERYSVDELLKLRSHFLAEVQRENRKNKGMSGLGPRIAVRF
jgi:hypothetical protein